MAKHKKIVLRVQDFLKLYFARTFGSCFPQCIFGGKKRQKLMKLYEMAEERLEKEMNMVKIIKSLRTIKILMKSSLLTEEVKK
jgi:hypothetical protein